MKSISAKRLLKLADFLEKLPKEKFDYRYVVNGRDEPRKKLDCGSTGCAIGWCPIVFPRLVEYYNSSPSSYDGLIHFVRPKGNTAWPGGCDTWTTAGDLFQIPRSAAKGLFFAGSQYLIDMPSLGQDASAKEVAGLIRKFVARETKKV